MTDARKNGTKPKITPFRLSAKPSINKDAPIFDDVPYAKKKRKLSSSKTKGNEEEPGQSKVEKDLETSDTASIGKTTPTSTRRLSGGFGKVFGDPLKYNVADPFAIMTAEPDEDETVDDDQTIETEKESDKEELVDATESPTTNSAATGDKETAQDEKGESVESAEIESVDSKGENEVVDPVNDDEEQIENLEEDMLEINADIDSSTLRDTDDIFDDNLMEKVEKERKKEGKEKRHKKHKRSEKHERSDKHGRSERHDKGERRKKRRKERHKSEDAGQDKRHKKRRRVSRSRDRSRSRSSSKRRRRNRSRDRSPNKSSRASSRRDLPRQGSRSRSPMRRATSHNRDQASVSPMRRGKDQSPSHKRSHLASVEKIVRDKSPRSKIQREKTSREKSSEEKNLNEISPRRLNRKSKSGSPEPLKDNKGKGKLRNKSNEERSPKKRSNSRTSLDSTRKKSYSDNTASVVANFSPGRKSMADDDTSEVKESDVMLNPDVKKSPISGSQLKSYVHVVSKDPTPLVPYDEDITSMSPWDSADGLNVQSDKETPVQEAEPPKAEKSKQPKHKGSDEGEPGKKAKGKKKSKKSQEKKRKKKASAKIEDPEDVERNTDDEFDDLLFTKTNKESKEADVFNDSEVFSAKHNIRAAVVDLDRKKVRTIGSPVGKDSKLSPLRKETLNTKRLSPRRNERLSSKKPTSTAVVGKDSPEPDQPEKFSEVSETEIFAPGSLPDVSTLDEPPSQGGTSTIPFLSHDEEPGLNDDFDQFGESDSPRHINDDYDVEQSIENENAPYSPVAEPVESNDAPYSPVEEPGSDFGSPQKSSTMNLSDISTKDTVVKDAVGVITSTEKVEDFLDRIQPPEQSFSAVDIDMSSPANGMGRNSEEDDDIIEQLHKEFVRAQHQQSGTYRDNHVAITSSTQDIPENTISTTNIPSPLHTAASDPIVQAYGLNKNYDTIMKSKHSKRSKQKKSKSTKEDNKPLAKEKKDIEEALNRVHRQARVEDEMKHALKVYFKRKDITKEEYKMILRKGVPQVANSNHTIDPERIRSLVKKYVAKYKGSRERHAKQNTSEQQEIPFTFSP